MLHYFYFKKLFDTGTYIEITIISSACIEMIILFNACIELIIILNGCIEMIIILIQGFILLKATRNAVFIQFNYSIVKKNFGSLR